MAGIYLHIPFCKQACHYCDFHFSTSQNLRLEIIQCLQKELEMQRTYLNEPIETVYFGGGTPSVLTSSEIAHLLQTVKDNFEIADQIEITLEANPDDLSDDYLIKIKDVGINRLSIGVQSFDSNILQFLNRAHNDQQAHACIEMAKRIGFDNISIDLIYGIPGRDNGLWEADLDLLINYNPNHISAYCLTIEPKTVFGNWSKKGKLETVSDDFSATQFDLMLGKLEKAGYEQYEVSNFSKPGAYSKHNTSYWQQKPYLGIGPSAHSYNLVSRQYNVSNNVAYVKALKNNVIPFTAEALSDTDKINDYLLTTLRTKWGSEMNRLLSWGYYPDWEYIEQLQKAELLEYGKEVLILTKKGWLLADEITAKLFK